MQIVRRLLALVAFLVVGGAIGLVIWSAAGPDPEPTAMVALAGSAEVLVIEEPWLTFEPVAGADTGLILYPGARIPPEAYAPLASRIAAQGYLVVIPRVPLGLAILSPGVAADVIDERQDIDRWVVGGHSLGGAMAASFVDSHPGEVRGLVLWAAYPAASVNIADEEIFVTAIAATADGLVSFEEISAARDRLPASFELVPVEGGNHAGFGAYGPQDGDGEATLERDAQWDLIVAATVRLLDRVSFG